MNYFKTRTDSRDLVSLSVFLGLVLVAFLIQGFVVDGMYLFEETVPTLPGALKDKIENLFLVFAVITSGVFATTLYLKLTLVQQARELAREMMGDLLSSREQFRTLYDNSPMPYFLIDEAGAIQRPNKATLRFFGGTEEEVVQIHLLESLHSPNESTHPISILLTKIERGVPISREELLLRTLSGKERWVQLSVFFLEQPGLHGLKRLVSLVDITEEKEIDRVKTEFVSLASHQLRTPLTAIKWHIDLLLTSNTIQVSDEVRTYLTRIYQGNQRMIDLVSTLLNVSRIEMGTVPLEVSRVPLKELAQDVLDEVRDSAVQKGLHLVDDLERASDAMTDRSLLRIILQNLLTNAIRYTLKEGTVELRIISSPTGHTLTVNDTGVGIPPEAQAKLFTKMFRAENAKQLEAKGTGLGLYMTKAFAEKLGGRIEFTSAVGKGTSFTVHLPIAARP